MEDLIKRAREKLPLMKNRVSARYIERVFETFERNFKDDAEKNVLRIVQSLGGSIEDEADVTSFEGKSHNFFFEATESDELSRGEMDLESRTFKMNPDEFSAANFLDVLVFFHELVHIHQNILKRSQSTPVEFEEYIESNKQAPEVFGGRVVDIGEELEAWGMEMELLNLFLDGMIQEAVASGRKLKRGDYLQALTKLELPKSSLHDLAASIEVGLTYYDKTGSSDKVFYTRTFVEKLIEIHEEQGLIPVWRDPSGNLVPGRKFLEYY